MQRTEDSDRSLAQCVVSLRLSQEVVRAKSSRIYHAVLDRSNCIAAGDFEAVSARDLEILFDLYDKEFFSGRLKSLFEHQEGPEITFRISSRLTKSGGKTSCWRGRPRFPQARYEIAVSSTLLFHTFNGETREIAVGGVDCHDRLEALLRIFEHELIHLIEFIVWDKSSCTGPRFKALVGNIFGHTRTHHRLVTPQETAWSVRRMRVGDRARFECKGIRYEGVINRITRRATVLVEDPDGEGYSDGKRYLKYYVPLGMLTRIDA